MNDLTQLARYENDAAWSRLGYRRDIRSRQSLTAANASSIARIDRYEADEGAYYTDQGPSDLIVTNAGLESGQIVDWSGRAIDSTPRRKPTPAVTAVFGGEEIIWGAVFSRQYYLGSGPGGFRYENRAWFCSNQILEPVQLAVTPVNTVNLAPQIYVFLSVDESQTFYVDLKIVEYFLNGLGQDEARPVMQLRHFEIRGAIVESIATDSVSESNWRRPWVTSAADYLGPSGEVDSCLERFWSDGQIYTAPATNSVQVLSQKTGAWNIVKNQSTLYRGTFGDLSGPLASGRIGFSLYQTDLNSCSLNLQDPDPPQTGSVIANFPPIDLSATLNPDTSGGGQFQSIQQGATAAIVL